MGQKKVLIVDDDTHTCSLLADTLHLEDWQVLQAGTGEEALNILKTEMVDLILLDLLLPGIKGWDVAEELKNNPKTSKIPVILMSILPPEDATYIAQKNAAVASYVCKPFDIETLTNEIKRVAF